MNSLPPWVYWCAAVLTGCGSFVADEPSQSVPAFTEVTEQVGLLTNPTWKYGGPVVADINNDGYYDLILGQHDREPAPLFWGSASGNFHRLSTPVARWDVHGIAAADYDLDGDGDLLVSLGGGNGTQPQPPRLVKNNNGRFDDITEGSGIEHMGARGRSVRWVDLDLDGDLDLLQINAAQIIGETGPRNILFENTGQGFVYRASPGFEQLDAERVLVTDINGDSWSDLLVWSPYDALQVLTGSGPFRFSNQSDQYLPGELADIRNINAVANADIDNDGDMDFYLARGKVYYQIANNTLEYDAGTKRIDLRDEGNKSHDGLSFTASGDIHLTDFYFFPRGGKVDEIPLYLGAAKIRHPAPAAATTKAQRGFAQGNRLAVTSDVLTLSPEQARGFPERFDKTGWYLGYLGDGQWRFEWFLAGDDAWDVRASIIGADSVTPDFTPQNLQVADLILLNEGDHFRPLGLPLPAATTDNNWGVITADFNNDSRQDFFIYRFGRLTQRIADVMLLNNGDYSFTQIIKEDATHLGVHAHGDMGAALDYDQDGFVDILSGDDDNGRWHLYRNQGVAGHYLQVNVGYSETGVDPVGASVELVAADMRQRRLVNSGSATHSQSVLNLVHFGLGRADQVDSVRVTWRDGSQQTFTQVAANRRIQAGVIHP